MPTIDPFDDDFFDEAASAVPPPTSPLFAPPPLVAHDADPRATLARILQRLIEAFGTDAGATVDRVLAQSALALTRYVHSVYPLRATIIGLTSAGKTRFLNVVASVVQLPAFVIPVVDLAETGWKGAAVGEACRLLHPTLFVRDQVSRRTTDPSQTVAFKSVVMLGGDQEAQSPVRGGSARRVSGGVTYSMSIVSITGIGPAE